MAKVSSAEAVNAPVEVLLDGKTYHMRGLTDEAIGYFERWCGSQLIQHVRDSFDGRTTDAQQERELGVAYKQAASLRIDSDFCKGMSQKPEGVTQLLWAVLHYGGTYEHDIDHFREISKRDPGNLARAMQAFATLTGIAGAGKKGAPARTRR